MANYVRHSSLVVKLALRQTIQSLAMSLSSETVKQDIDLLNSDQLQQIADFIAFLRFRDKRRRSILDPAQLALLTTEFADEDKAIAEEDMHDYAAILSQEDQL